MEVHITLYGDSADLFEEIADDLEEERGIEPSNAAVVRQLMYESERPTAMTR